MDLGAGGGSTNVDELRVDLLAVDDGISHSVRVCVGHKGRIRGKRSEIRDTESSSRDQR